MIEKQIIIDGFNLEYIKELLYNGQRSAITTKIFEEIIEKLERKEQECEELKNQVNSSADTITRLVKKIEEYEKEYKRLEDENKILHKLKELL